MTSNGPLGIVIFLAAMAHVLETCEWIFYGKFECRLNQLSQHKMRAIHIQYNKIKIKTVAVQFELFQKCMYTFRYLRNFHT